MEWHEAGVEMCAMVSKAEGNKKTAGSSARPFKVLNC
jgi:hypothetical protein